MPDPEVHTPGCAFVDGVGPCRCWQHARGEPDVPRAHVAPPDMLEHVVHPCGCEVDVDIKRWWSLTTNVCPEHQQETAALAEQLRSVAEGPVLLPGRLMAHAEDGADVAPARPSEVDGLDDEVVNVLVGEPGRLDGLGEQGEVLTVGHASSVPDASSGPDSAHNDGEVRG